MPRHDYYDRQEAKRERLEERAAKHIEAGEARWQAGWDALRAIPLGQPILVDHYSANRDRNYRARAGNNIDRGREQVLYGQELAARAETVGTAGISQDAPDAIDRLRAKLASLEAENERAKMLNAAIRKVYRDASRHRSSATVAGIEAAGIELTEAERAYLSSNERIGWPLQFGTLSARIREVKQRIETIERTEATDFPTIERSGFTIEDDRAENRLVLTLSERVGAETFKWIRSMGWRWSRTAQAFYAYRSHRWHSWFADALAERLAPADELHHTGRHELEAEAEGYSSTDDVCPDGPNCPDSRCIAIRAERLA